MTLGHRDSPASVIEPNPSCYLVDMKSRIALFVVLTACGPKSAELDEVGSAGSGGESGSGSDSGAAEPETGFETGGSETWSETGSETGSDPTEPPIPPIPPVPPSGPVIPIDPDAPPIVYFVGQEVWRISADGSDATPLGLSASPGGGSAHLYYGTNYATVTRDGTRMAYLEQDAVMVATLDTDVVETKKVFELPPNTWTLLTISTWSPDSSTLLAFASEADVADAEEAPPPLPIGFELGAYAIDADTMTANFNEHVWGWLEWAGDKDVLSNPAEWGDENLFRYSLAGGEPTLVRATDSLHGFMQLYVAGDRMVWTEGGGGGQSLVMLASPLDGEGVVFSPKLGWGDIQFPRLAPNHDRVFMIVYGVGTISESADEQWEISLPWLVSTRWEGDQHLLAVTQDGLVRVDIHGNTTVLDPAATTLPMQ